MSYRFCSNGRTRTLIRRPDGAGRSKSKTTSYKGLLRGGRPGSDRGLLGDASQGTRSIKAQESGEAGMTMPVGVGAGGRRFAADEAATLRQWTELSET